MIDKKARDYLLGIPLWTKKKNTLDEVRHFLKELGNPDEQLNIIHVAGTNGKGSVCADLTAMLMEAGYHVGTFVSPHLTDVTERFLVDGVPVEEAGFSESFARVKAVTDRLTAEATRILPFLSLCFSWPWTYTAEKAGFCGSGDGTGRTAGYHQCDPASAGLRDHLHQPRPYPVSWRYGGADRGGEGRYHQAGYTGGV
mgnify:CR=1 FL=1